MNSLYARKPLTLFLSQASYYVQIMNQGNHEMKGPRGSKKLANAFEMSVLS